MARWTLPSTDRGVAAWLCSMPDQVLDRFIADSEYLLGGEGDSEQLASLATIVGAARRWRDDGLEPLTTMQSVAAPGFYNDDED
jgi:hypothetical protein